MITSVELKHLDTSFSGLTTFQGDSGVKKIMLVMIIFNWIKTWRDRQHVDF